MIELIRFLDHGRENGTTKPMGCMGELYIDDKFVCYTMEQPWRENRRYVSCVPTGAYHLVPYHSKKYGDVVALTNGANVWAHESEAGKGHRFACLFHAANWSSQLQGCIAPGENIAFGRHKDSSNNVMVTSSRKTLNKLLPRVIDKQITIRWKHG